MASPTMKTTDLSIADVIDLGVLQRIQDTFAQAMGVAAVTVDRGGKPITKTSNFCRLCLLIRSTEEGLKRCQRCDAEGGRRALAMNRPYAYNCAGGLMDAAAPIMIDGHFVGSILCGQAIPDDAQENYIESVVRHNAPLGLPVDAIEDAAREITPLSRERFTAAVEMLSITANYVIEMGVARLAQTELLNQAQEQAALKVALQEAQLRAFKAQINPHFLFNSLTLLGYTALEEAAPRTERIAYDLSDLLRYSLRNISTQVELGEEFAMIRQYLEIQKVSFGDRLTFTVDLAPELEHFEVPCMIIQPLVENAVLHGAEPISRPVQIAVRAFAVDDRLVLEIADDGVGMPIEIAERINTGFYSGEGDSLGLQNVLYRLGVEYGAEFAAKAETAPDRGTCLRLSLPLEAAGGAATPSAEILFPGPVCNLIGNQLDFSAAGLNTLPSVAARFPSHLLDGSGSEHRVDNPVEDIVLEPLDTVPA